VLKIEKTASSKVLGKSMLIVERDNKEEVEDFMENLFDQFPENFQSGQFKKPQRGGNSFQKNRASNISNYLNKLEEQVNADLLMYDEESISMIPPQRPRKITLSYAQATRRLSFRSDPKITTTTNKTESSAANMTTMSTLTQTSLEEAMAKIRSETENSINRLRQELKNEVKSMEDKIASAVVAAMRSNPPMDSMETENTDAISTQSSQTAATIQTLADKYDTLHNAMIMLTNGVSKLAEIQTQQVQKRNRPLDTIPKFRLPPANNSPKSPAQQSPLTKVPRAEHFDRLTTPPPNGTLSDGAQEGQ
jgi:hypothetical protein